MPTTTQPTSEARHIWTASRLMLTAVATALVALATQPEPVTFEVAPADSFTHGHHQDLNPPADMFRHLNNQEEPAL